MFFKLRFVTLAHLVKFFNTNNLIKAKLLTFISVLIITLLTTCSFSVLANNDRSNVSYISQSNIVHNQNLEKVLSIKSI